MFRSQLLKEKSYNIEERDCYMSKIHACVVHNLGIIVHERFYIFLSIPQTLMIYSL